jgi:hypothetical protein
MGSDLPLCDPLWVFYSSGFLSRWLGALFNKACFIKKALVGTYQCWLVGLFVVVMVLFNWSQSKINTYTMNLPKIRNYVACLWSSYIVYKGEKLSRDKVWCYWEHIENVIGNNWEPFGNMVEP